jgi:hypothetical protein
MAITSRLTITSRSMFNPPPVGASVRETFIEYPRREFVERPIREMVTRPRDEFIKAPL